MLSSRHTPPTASWSHLPDLVLERIFVYMEEPLPFSTVNKPIYELSRSDTVRAQWFLYQFGKSMAFSRSAFHSYYGAKLLSPKIIRILVRDGAHVHVDKFFVLEHMAALGHHLILNYLLSITAQSFPHQVIDRVLIVGVDCSDLTVVQLALQYGACINTHQSYPLRYSCYRHNIKLVRYLLQRGAHPTKHAILLTSTKVRQHLIGVRQLNIELPATLNALVQESIEIIRWLVWYGGDEKLATRTILSFQSSLSNYPLDAIGSHWFVDQPITIAVPPPPFWEQQTTFEEYEGTSHEDPVILSPLVPACDFPSMGMNSRLGTVHPFAISNS